MSKRQKALERQQRLRKIQAVVLALIFVGVLWFQFGRGGHMATAKTKKKTKAVAAKNLDKKPTQVKAQVKLARLDIETILASNPFGRPAEQVERKPEIVNADSFTPPKVSAIYKAPNGWVALIDSTAFRTGDFLPGGYRVIDITSDGIRLAPR